MNRDHKVSHNRAMLTIGLVVIVELNGEEQQLALVSQEPSQHPH